MEAQIPEIARSMARKSPQLSQEEVGKLIAFGGVLIGTFLYLYQPWLAGFPINDGGLFYTTIRAIQLNGFRLPSYVVFNGLNIPFAYPPLALYLGALLSSGLRLDPIVILQWLPACVLIAVSAVFYPVARRLLDAPIPAGIATFLYVCTPRSSTWLVMGGGLTRGLGQLFLLLTVLLVHSLYTQRENKYIHLSILTGSLVVLTHPEAAVHTVAACLLCWIFAGRNRRTALDSLWVAAGVAAVTAIWWIPVLLRHGVSPFIAAGQTGLHNAQAFVYPLFMMFTEEPAMTLVAALGTIGFFVASAEKKWLLPAWLLVPFAVDPRSAGTVAIIPLAMLAASALHEVILPAIAGASPQGRAARLDNYLESGAVKAAIGYMEAFLLAMAVYTAMQLAEVRVSLENRTAFEWATQNTPSESRFLVITGATQPFCDPVQEWFPALTGRISTTTIQGSEWLGSRKFLSQMAGLQQVQLCVDGAEPVTCLRHQAAISGLDFDHVYVLRSAPITRACRVLGERRSGDALLAELHQDSSFVTVYQTDAVEILRFSP